MKTCKQPAKDDLIVLYNLFQDGEFRATKDVQNKLNMSIRKLSISKIVIRVRRINDQKSRSSWVYKINPSLCFYLKRGEMPSIGKV